MAMPAHCLDLPVATAYPQLDVALQPSRFMEFSLQDMHQAAPREASRGPGWRKRAAEGRQAVRGLAPALARLLEG